MTDEERKHIKNEMMRYYEMGMSISEMGERLGIKKATAYYYAELLGFEKKEYIKFTEAEKTEIAKMYHSGFTPKKIASIIGSSTKQIHNYITNHLRTDEPIYDEELTEEELQYVTRVTDERKSYKVTYNGKHYVDVTEFYT